MAERISAGKAVRLSYRLLDGAGVLLEERTPESAATYVHGQSQLLPAVERALEGQSAGYRISLRLRPEEAYGVYEPTLLAEIERDRFPSEVELAPGAKFTTEGPDGTPMVVRVLEVDDDSVSLDGNHPLAGLELVFEIIVLEVAASLEDLTNESDEAGDPSRLH